MHYTEKRTSSAQADSVSLNQRTEVDAFALIKFVSPFPCPLVLPPAN
jgi:hypothetical protein